MKLQSEMPALVGATEWVNGEPTATEVKEAAAVLVHFWAVSCYMCKDGLPVINEWREQYKDKGLRIIGIHMPRSEKDTDIAAAKEAIEKYGLTHPVAIDNEHALVELFENQHVPSYYLFDGDLKLRHFQAGEKALPMVKRRLHRILGIED